MVNNLVGVRWDQSLSEVERSQTGRASSGMLVEGLEGGSDSQRVNCRRKPYVGSTQPGEVGVATRRRVLTDHLIEDNIGVGRRRRVESLAGLGGLIVLFCGPVEQFVSNARNYFCFNSVLTSSYTP